MEVLYNWFQNIDFAYPWLMLLFLVLPVLIISYIRNHNRRLGAFTISSITQVPGNGFCKWIEHTDFLHDRSLRQPAFSYEVYKADD